MHFYIANDAGIFLRIFEDGFKELQRIVIGIDAKAAVPKLSFKHLEPSITLIEL